MTDKEPTLSYDSIISYVPGGQFTYFPFDTYTIEGKNCKNKIEYHRLSNYQCRETIKQALNNVMPKLGDEHLIKEQSLKVKLTIEDYQKIYNNCILYKNGT